MYASGDILFQLPVVAAYLYANRNHEDFSMIFTIIVCCTYFQEFHKFYIE